MSVARKSRGIDQIARKSVAANMANRMSSFKGARDSKDMLNGLEEDGMDLVTEWVTKQERTRL